MSIDLVTNFVEAAPVDPASAWDYEAIIKLAGNAPPSTLFGDQEPLMRGDQHRLWLRWFIEGLVSPHVFARERSLGKLEVYAAAFRRVSAMYPMVDLPRRKKLADLLTEHIAAEVERARSDLARDSASAATRLELLAEHTPARCYICGYAFSRQAQDAFLKVKGRDPIVLPLLVDVLRPRGLRERDVKIEVEHLVPVAAGGHGQDNLRLACGWCNMHKSARVSLYEVSFLPPRSEFLIGRLRLFELPNPFWTIRILALRKRCQHVDGCVRTAADSELFVAYSDWSGSPNPTNLTVYCAEHDSIRADRYQARAKVEQLWRERVR